MNQAYFDKTLRTQDRNPLFDNDNESLDQNRVPNKIANHYANEDSIFMSESEDSESLSFIDRRQDSEEKRIQIFGLKEPIQQTFDGIREREAYGQFESGEELGLIEKERRDLSVPKNTPLEVGLPDGLIFLSKQNDFNLDHFFKDIGDGLLQKRDSDHVDLTRDHTKCQFGDYGKLSVRREEFSIDEIKKICSSTEGVLETKKIKKEKCLRKIIFEHLEPCKETLKNIKRVKIEENDEHVEPNNLEKDEINDDLLNNFINQETTKNFIFEDPKNEIEKNIQPCENKMIKSVRVNINVSNKKSKRKRSEEEKFTIAKIPSFYTFENTDLDKMEKIFEEFLDLKDFSRESFEEMTEPEKIIFSIILFKIYKMKEIRSLTFKQILSLQKRQNGKRNEEIFKIVYKPFLKHHIKNFEKNIEFSKKGKKKSPKFIQKVKELRESYEKKGIRLEKKLLECHRWLFFLTKFRSLIFKEDSPSKDLMLDIVEEKIDIAKKSKEKLNSLNNWSTKKKSSAMKKISASFRCLVYRSLQFRKDFNSFIHENSKNGLISKKRDEKNKKLKSIINRWKKIYETHKNSDDQLILHILKEIENPKFKFPWSIRRIKKAIEKCEKDFEICEFEEEYESVKQSHYSMKQ